MAEVAAETPPEGVTVEVDDAGAIHVNGEPVPDGGLGPALETALAAGEPEAAVKRYRRSLDLDPDNTVVEFTR